MRNRFAASYILELRLIALHWSFWVINLLWAGFHLLELNIYTTFNLSAQNWLVGGLLRNTIGFMGMAVIVIAAVSASRAFRANFDMLEKSYPVDIEVLFGRALAVLTCAASFLIAPLVLTAYIGPLDSFLRGVPIFVGNILLTFAFIIAVVYALQVIMELRRWMYPLLILGWIGGAAAANIINTDGLPAPGITLLNFPRSINAGYSEMFGRLTQGNFPLWFNLFYIGVVLLLCGGIVWRYRVRWLRTTSNIGRVLIIVGLVIAGYGGINYTVHTAEANAQVRQLRTDYETVDTSIYARTLPYAATDYQIALDLSGDVPQFTVQMQLTNTGDAPVSELLLTLNDQLTITQSNTSYERETQFITFMPDEPLAAGTTQTIAFTYEGQLLMREQSLGVPPEPDDFIYDAGLRLQFDSFWYPLVGHIEYNRPIKKAVPDILATMRLTVTGADHMNFASNLTETSENHFQSNGVTWALLVGSPTVTQHTRDGIDFVTAEFYAIRLTDSVEAIYTDAINDYRLFFPSFAGINIFLSDDRFDPLYGWNSAPMTNNQTTVFTRPYTIQATSPAEEEQVWFDVIGRGAIGVGNRYEEVHKAFSRSLYASEGSYLIDNVATFMYLWEGTEGNADEMRETFEVIRENDTEFAFMSSAWHQLQRNPQQSARENTLVEQPLALTDVLITSYKEDGTEATAGLLQALRANADELNEREPQEIVDWIETNYDAD